MVAETTQAALIVAIGFFVVLPLLAALLFGE